MNYWFTKRKIGWGWRPISKEGWVISLILLALLLLSIKLFGKNINFIISIIILIILFAIIADKHMEKPLIFKKRKRG